MQQIPPPQIPRVSSSDSLREAFREVVLAEHAVEAFGTPRTLDEALLMQTLRRRLRFAEGAIARLGRHAAEGVQLKFIE